MGREDQQREGVVTVGLGIRYLSADPFATVDINNRRRRKKTKAGKEIRGEGGSWTLRWSSGADPAVDLPHWEKREKGGGRRGGKKDRKREPKMNAVTGRVAAARVQQISRGGGGAEGDEGTCEENRNPAKDGQQRGREKALRRFPSRDGCGEDMEDALAPCNTV